MSDEARCCRGARKGHRGHIGRHASAGRHVAGASSGVLEWNRVVTRFDRDTDVILTGIGYRW
ncbi:hypothetical protein EYW47_16790 [Paraburkholderia silviterrae]|uniref:Uncharacterized protein n=1 Tax=Paraburkholderia silviterrae TaxID=2528715 RepID=A0A4R5M9F6_9BURK|nr:hypothetical protein EYW47_16790 [Paraburkholderia silviterrae]